MRAAVRLATNLILAAGAVFLLGCIVHGLLGRSSG